MTYLRRTLLSVEIPQKRVNFNSPRSLINLKTMSNRSTKTGECFSFEKMAGILQKRSGTYLKVICHITLMPARLTNAVVVSDAFLMEHTVQR